MKNELVAIREMGTGEKGKVVNNIVLSLHGDRQLLD